jgi:AraC family transcriptional regulator
MAAMAAFASNERENKVAPLDGINCVPLGTPHFRAIVDTNAWSPLRGIVLHPTVSIAPAKSIRRLSTGWHWWSSESLHVPVGRTIEFRFQGNTHLLILYDEGVRKNGETSIDGLPSSRLRDFARKLTFVPAGHAYREWHETDASTRMTFLYLDPAAFQKSSDGEGGLRPPRIYFDDPIVWETACKLKSTIESGQTGHKSYLEALSSVLAHELSRVDRQIVRDPAANRGGLAGWQKRAVVEYIEAHLGDRVRLSTLAGLARLSVHHFCRAFKRSVGIPAHKYQVHRRMEVAKSLLADRTMPVTDIALTLGYAHTNSFGNAFRKTTGWTPTVYRRECK